MTFDEELSYKISSVNTILNSYLPDREKSVTEDAMRYSVTAGGKRLRPVFLLSVFELFPCAGNKRIRETAECFAAALEFVHTYSLVHDDLPEMDNDMYRRGKLTTHAKFGGAMGVLAGDALLNSAFTITASRIEHLTTDEAATADEIRRAVHAQRILAEYAGSDGMILGQEIDLMSEGIKLPEDKLLRMYELKTSRLLQIAFRVGAVLGGANTLEEEIAEQAALNLGIAFQLQDDVLDMIGDEKKLGKPVLSDEKNDKKTYAAIVGVAAAGEKSKEYTEKAISSVEKLPGDTGFIKRLMIKLIERDS